MEQQSILLAIGLLLIAGSFYQIAHSNTADEDLNTFKQWVIKHKKSYQSHENFQYRFSIFMQNLKVITDEIIQSLEAHRSDSYTVGLNKFSDMTFEEFAQLYLVPIPQPVSAHYTELASAENNAAEINWVKKGAVTQVYDQGKCGSCWAFSATGALEGLWQLKSGQLVPLSKQQLMDCSTSYGNKGCGGGWMDWAFDYVWDEKIMAEANYPYEGSQGGCRADDRKGLSKSEDTLTSSTTMRPNWRQL